MKKTILLLLLATVLVPASINAQFPGGNGRRGGAAVLEPLSPEALKLPRFDLDFPGGNPRELVKAIERVSKPLNAIIPDEYADMRLPPLKLRAVNVPELFQALIAASQKQTNVISRTIGGGGFGGGNGGLINPSNPSYTIYNISFGFKTIGEPREDSIWSFYYDGPSLLPEQVAASKPPSTCRFFQLGPYLETYKIEDITTAIETGWKMLGAPREFTPPQISFHKDTKLLIAVGDPEKLTLIDSVLQQLPVKQPPGRPGMPVPIPQGIIHQ